MSKQFQRGMKHGKLNVWNPGILLGTSFDQYQAGWHKGRRERFKVVGQQLTNALEQYKR